LKIRRKQIGELELFLPARDYSSLSSFALVAE